MKVTQKTIMQSFYKKYFYDPECSQHSVTSISGMRTIPIYNNRIVNRYDPSIRFIKGEFAHYVPEDVIPGSNVSGYEKGVITLITQSGEILMFTVVLMENGSPNTVMLSVVSSTHVSVLVVNIDTTDADKVYQYLNESYQA